MLGLKQERKKNGFIMNNACNTYEDAILEVSIKTIGTKESQQGRAIIRDKDFVWVFYDDSRIDKFKRVDGAHWKLVGLKNSPNFIITLISNIL